MRGIVTAVLIAGGGTAHASNLRYPVSLDRGRPSPFASSSTGMTGAATGSAATGSSGTTGGEGDGEYGELLRSQNDPQFGSTKGGSHKWRGDSHWKWVHGAHGGNTLTRHALIAGVNGGSKYHEIQNGLKENGSGKEKRWGARHVD